MDTYIGEVDALIDGNMVILLRTSYEIQWIVKSN